MATDVVAAPNFIKRATIFYEQVMVEMRKVSWPDRPQLQSATIQIIVFVLFIGALIALMDLGLQFFLVRLPQLLLGR